MSIFWKTNAWYHNIIHGQVKDPFKVHDRPIQKLIGFVSVFTFPVTFKEMIASGVSSKKNMHSYPKRLLKYSFLFQLHVCMRPDSCNILQIKKYMAKDWMCCSSSDGSCLPLSWILKRFKKCETFSLTFFHFGQYSNFNKIY